MKRPKKTNLPQPKIGNLNTISQEALEHAEETAQAFFDVQNDKDKELYHYGTPRHSGRYPWGSGENPYQGDIDFKAHVKQLKSKGWSQKEIAKSMNMTTSQLRARIDIASENVTRARDAEIFKLRDKNYSKVAIARQLDIPESTVRNVLKKVDKVKEDSTRAIADRLKKAVEEQKYIDIGHGCESMIGVSKDKLRHAVALLEQEGFKRSFHEQPQMGTSKSTTMKILASQDTPWAEIEAARKNAEIDFPGFHYEHNDYTNPHKLETPTSVSSKRIMIAYPDSDPEKDGAAKDGLI